MSGIIKSNDCNMLFPGGAENVKLADLSIRTCDIVAPKDEADIECMKILEDAKMQAEIMINTARSEVNELRQQAYDEGFAAGMENAASDTKALIERLESDIAAVEAERSGLLEAAEPEVLKLLLELVEKVIRHEIKTDTRIVIRTIKSCLRRVKDNCEIHVRVNPREIEDVRAKRDELMSACENLRAINIIDDRRISPGGCVIESPSGDFDARVETQVDKLRKKIMETLENDANKTGFESS